jgi:hypothetical protein
MDPRLRAAVDASVQWYDAVFGLHGIETRVQDGLWSALDRPPPWHSAVKTVAPGIPPERVVRAAAGFEHCAVADSFGDLELAGHGFAVLIEATWLHLDLDLDRVTTGRLPDGWSVVDTVDVLTEWTAAHDYAGVLPPAVLEDDRFRILARHRRGLLVGGAVVHDGGRALDLSNSWGAARMTESDEVLRAVTALHPARAVTSYAQGAERDALMEAGFTPLGPQRVWVR